MEVKSNKPKARLEGWVYDTDKNCLTGFVFGHPKFEDGEEIKTSPVVNMTGKLVETLNSFFELGTAKRDMDEDDDE